MERIKVFISWANGNFSGSYSDNVPGGVAFTGKTIDEMRRKAQTTLDFHLQGYVEDGECPQWYIDHDYELEFCYTDATSLLQSCSAALTLSAIARATGINQRQLSHYANGTNTPRPQQQQRIIDGIHAIGRRLMAV